MRRPLYRSVRHSAPGSMRSGRGSPPPRSSRGANLSILVGAEMNPLAAVRADQSQRPAATVHADRDIEGRRLDDLTVELQRPADRGPRPRRTSTSAPPGPSRSPSGCLPAPASRRRRPPPDSAGRRPRAGHPRSPAQAGRAHQPRRKRCRGERRRRPHASRRRRRGESRPSGLRADAPSQALTPGGPITIVPPQSKPSPDAAPPTGDAHVGHCRYAGGGVGRYGHWRSGVTEDRDPIRVTEGNGTSRHRAGPGWA
jgi:hypothetical protein